MCPVKYSDLNQVKQSAGNSVASSKIRISSNWFEIRVCPRSSDPFYFVSYYIKGVITSTYSVYMKLCKMFPNI